MLVGKKVSIVSLPPPPISSFFSGGDTDRRGGINTAVATDVNAIFKGKTVSAVFGVCGSPGVEIKHYSVAQFDHVTAFKVL